MNNKCTAGGVRLRDDGRYEYRWVFKGKNYSVCDIDLRKAEKKMVAKKNMLEAGANRTESEQDTITSQVVYVTPELAREWLSHNEVNRPLDRSKVAMYSREMKSGKWQLNGETIAISVTGKLKNGQHRLSAVANTGCIIPFVVIFGVSDNVTIYDRGKTRTTKDVLVLEGLPPELANNVSIGMGRLHIITQTGRRNISDMEVMDFLVENSESIEKIHRMLSPGSKKGLVRTWNSTIALACYYAYNSGVALETLTKFTDTLRTGFGDEYSSSAVVLRNDIISGNVSLKQGGYEREKSLPAIEKAIWDYDHKIARKYSYKNMKDPIYSCNPRFAVLSK